MNYFKLIRETIDYLHVNYEKQVNIDGLSDKFHISKFHLYRLFRAITGYTISEYLDQVRLNEVRVKLKTTDLTLLQVALSCGFNSHEVMTRKFKKYHGLTPKSYRISPKIINPFNKIKVIEREIKNKKSDLVVDYTIKYFGGRDIIGKSCNNGYDDHIDEHTIGNFLFDFADSCFEDFPEGKLYLTIMYIDRTTNHIDYFVGFDYLFDDSSYAKQRIEASNYAVFKYKGVFKDNIKAIVNDIYRTIAISNLEINDIGVAFIEVYDKQYLDTGVFEIHVPVL